MNNLNRFEMVSDLENGHLTIRNPRLGEIATATRLVRQLMGAGHVRVTIRGVWPNLDITRRYANALPLVGPIGSHYVTVETPDHGDVRLHVAAGTAVVVTIKPMPGSKPIPG